MKKILISGCSKGIGKFLTEKYLEDGHFVIGISRSLIEFSHPNFSHFICDISKETDVQKLISNLRSSNINSIDVLINNAGVASMNHSLLTPGTTLEKIFGTNVFGTFFLSREVSKLMRKSSSGRIINFSTVAVPLRLEGEAIYAASKSAVEILTKIMAKELSNLRITVNAIGPTPIDTDLIKNVPKEKIDSLIQNQSIKRLGTFKDIKNVIDFYIKDESNFITGQTLYLGGVG